VNPATDPTFQTVVSHLSWYFGQLYSREESFRLFRERYGTGLDPLLPAAWEAAQEAYANAERATLLAPNDPLELVLFGATPPSPDVSVRVHFEVRTVRGDLERASVIVNVPWSTTPEGVEQAASALWGQMRSRSTGLAPATEGWEAVTEWWIEGPLLYRDR
jgi:hypothetical protein